MPIAPPSLRRGRVATPPTPAGVPDAPASYGPNLRGGVLYLLVFQHVPIARVVNVVTHLSGRGLRRAGCAGLCGRPDALVEVETLIRTLQTAAHILHMDEMGTKVTGACWWQHVADTDMLATYHLHRTRGRDATRCP